MMKTTFMFIFSVIGLCTLSCSANDTVQDLDPETFSMMVGNDTTAVILDVRKSEEFNEGHLVNAQLLDFLDTENFQKKIRQLDRHKTYYVYCRSGRRSRAACLDIQKLGLRAYNMEGGILKWKEEGKAVVVPQPLVTPLTAESFRRNIFDYKKSLEWEYKGSRPVVIDFYATWCGPCKQMSPILAKMAEKYANKVQVYQVDVDTERELASVFGVQSIPMFVFIPLHGEPRSIVGGMTEDKLEKAFLELL